MMKAVSEFTKDYKVKTVVSLNPIMVDATGMCGSCRCTVDGKTVFGCVDGPDFDGHKIDFDELQKRLRLFKEQEDLINKNILKNDLSRKAGNY
jgi:ferredoxin--NADP+ reductase